MNTVSRIQEARLLAVERELKSLREQVTQLLEQMREVRLTAQIAAEDAYNLGQATQAARAAFRHFEEQEKNFTRAFRRRAKSRRR